MKTLLKVASILSIVASGFAFVGAILVFSGGSTLFVELMKYEEFNKIFAEVNNGNALFTGTIVTICLLSGIFYLLPGIFGIRSCNGENKGLLAGIVLMVIICLASLFTYNIIGIIIAVAYLVGGIGTYRENNKAGVEDK